MKKCNKCHVSYTGNLSLCPLCQSPLTGKDSDSVFPVNVKYDKDKLLFKILMLVTASISIIAMFVEYYITKNLYWSLYVVLGLITNYVLNRFFLNHYQNFFKLMTKYSLVLFILVFIWFLMIKSLIITTYIIPVMCIGLTLFNCVTMIVLKNNYISEYIKFILADIVYGFIPLLFVWFNLTKTPIIAFISSIFSLIVFIGLLIFCKDELKEEIQKILSL